MKQQLTKRWKRVMSLALAACLGIGLFTPGAMAANGSDMVLVEGDPVPSADSDYRASTYIQTSTPSAYANLSTDEALALAAQDRAATLYYFPVTMFDYDTDKFNASQHQADVEAQGTSLQKWTALYFNEGKADVSDDYWYNGFTTQPGYYSTAATYKQLEDGGYYIKDGDTYKEVKMKITGETGYVEADPQPEVTSDFPGGNSYYIRKDDVLYLVTDVIEERGWQDWNRVYWYEIYGTPVSEEQTLELGLMDTLSGIGVDVSDIPVTSVDVAEVETNTEPGTGTDATPAPEESADQPAESTEPGTGADATPAPDESADQPAEEPSDSDQANDVELYDNSKYICDTNRGGYRDDFYSEEPILVQGSTYTCTLVTVDGNETIDTVNDITDLSDNYTGRTIYTYKSTGETVPGGYISSKSYADYNVWTGNILGDNTYGGWVYNGLMEDTLDSEGNPQFTVPDSGIFTTDSVNGKTVYTNVGLPFVQDEDGYYVFDSSVDSARFVGGADSNKNLTWDDMPQTGPASAEGSNGFFPFNSSLDARSETNYHFGMRATVDFTMTPNGKLTSADDSSEDITFEFSGDDDVWVFVDDTLILDLGGIHDSVTGTINFATGDVTYQRTNRTDGNANKTSGIFEYVNGQASATTSAGNKDAVPMGNIYTKLGTTLDTFAAQDTHTLTIFYLERGQGGSNCKIKFNLPQRDSLTVQKSVSDKDSAGNTLTEDQLTTIANTQYTFTLYKDSTGFANQKYALYSENGRLIGMYQTDSTGSFALKDGQYARFYGITYEAGDTYYVVEKSKDGYETPTWRTEVTDGAGSSSDPNGWTAGTATITEAGNERSEQITFNCTNTLTYVSDLTVNAENDTVVIDYGLPVQINVTANDLVQGGKNVTQEITLPDTVTHGTVEVKDGQIVYTPTEALNEVVTFIYTLTATEASGNSQSDTATVTIIPATQMYYEQDFGTLVNYESGVWKTDDTVGIFQETNVPGNSKNSPYGADQCYSTDRGDSAGSVASVDTTSAPAKFSYQFTGTGTAILARLSNKTGYIYVTVKDHETGTLVDYHLYRDTRVIDDKIGTITLYNIPVFQITGLDYGTYDVTVTIAKPLASTPFGSEFYLDGIRIYDPLNPDPLTTDVRDAYASDNELYNKVVSLRDKLIADYTTEQDGVLNWTTGTSMENFVTLTDTDGQLLTAEDYKNIGPKEELYLNTGMSVTFSVVNWDPNGGKIYLGMKALTGAGSVQINGKDITLNNTIDQYYDISDWYAFESGVYTFTIKVTDGPVSLTNIKLTGGADFAITENSEVSFG